MISWAALDLLCMHGQSSLRAIGVSSADARVRACSGHTALDRPMLYGIVPINKTVAGALGAVVALLALAVVAVTVGWRLSVTRNRKSYKKWNEEVRWRRFLWCCSYCP